MTISQFTLCELMFFMRFRLPVQNAFKNSCKHSTAELGQKQRLPFYDASVVVNKNKCFLDILEQVGTCPRSRPRVHCLILCITVEIHMLECVYIAIKCHQVGLLLEFVTLIVAMLLH